MNFQFYVEKLFDSNEFQEFIKENKDAYPCGGFFVIDLENLKNPDNKNQIDYFVPSINKMFSFQLEQGVKIMPVENLGDIPKKIAMNYDLDFEEIEYIIVNKMRQEKINKNIQKILLSLQNKDNKDFFIGTIFTSNMGILKIVFDISEKKITNFTSHSFFDMMKVLRK